ncbi:MAG: hypothetical protein AB7G28_02435 [Pirellulales bacterium]
MRKFTLSMIVLFLAANTAMADPRAAINDVKKFSGKLREFVVVASPLVGDRTEAAKIRRSLSQMLDMLEKHYKCKATKTVEIDSNKRAITITFVSKTNPVISFIVVAQNDNLILEQATIGGFRVVNIDPYGLDQ